ncbi:zinc finger protein 431-like isoform X1 [Trichoplusia ni]|uniref:Zinc finger protein 431-like isoform X1 n=1 Tax=Trichoplusia ni TaxID=7111 RepID=A0A7E5WT11_TRINI|nr:zinc finger protein 431-like isoform X1 [Trichoplusia ni]
MSEVKNEIATYFGRCKCCLSYGYLKNMWTEHQFEGESEVYGEMLVDCFALTWDSSESIDQDQICEQCVNRLRDACDFKKIVLTSQEDFYRQLGDGDDKDTIPKLEDCDEEYLMVYKEADSDTADTADTDTADMDVSVNDASACDEEYEDVEYLEDEVGGDAKEALVATSSTQAQKPKRRRKADTPTDSDDGVKRKWPKRLPKNERFKTYKQYTEENLRQCLEAVRSGEITPNDAARKYNIPKKTICAKMRLEPTDVLTDNTTKTTNTLEIKKKEIKQRDPNTPPVDAKTKPAVKQKTKDKPVKRNVKKTNKVDTDTKIQSTDEDNAPVDAEQIRTRYKAIVDEKFKSGKTEPEKNDVNELAKHKDNLKTILHNTNATAIKGYWGVGYYCYFCDEHKETPSDLKTHNIEKHSKIEEVIQVKYVADLVIRLDITNLKCSLCDKVINTLEDTMEHLKTMHEKIIHSDVKNHIIPFKFDTEVLKCVMCEKEFKFFKLLSEHMSEHYRNYECNTCDRAFINKQSMQTHSYRHNRGVFKCAKCPKVFDCRPKKSAHERVVHTMFNKTRKCAFCDERFSTKDLVQIHEVKVHGVKPIVFSCTACNKSYKSQSSLITHKNRFHLMLRPHKCSYCEMAFFSKMELKSHTVTHTKTRDFKCNMCSKSFGTRCSLNQHVRCHLDDRRYKCDQCERGFVHRTAWKVHMRSKHGKIV